MRFLSIGACLVFVASAAAAPAMPNKGHPATNDWTSAYTKAQAFVKQLNLTELVSMVTGTGGPCVGNIAPIPRVNFTGFCLQDGPLAPRVATNVTTGVAGINAAASWDKDLILSRGQYMGQEFKGLGVNMALGPMMNLLRVPRAGRNWEGFGEDPYLAGVAAFQTVTGQQSSGVITTAKHYIGNEQETDRTTSSSNIDDRTIHEVYRWPFEQAVQAGTGAIMCSYNLLNGTYACQNNKTLNGLLKGELRYKGFVMSDWGAVHDGVASALNGLDMDMPGESNHYGPNLVAAVQGGRVPQSTVAEMATRVMAAYYYTGQDQGYPTVDLNRDVQANHKVDVRTMGTASVALLRNKNNVLPLTNNTGTLAIIGSDADNGTLAQGWGSGSSTFPYLVTPLQGITARAGSSIKIVSTDSDYDTANITHIASGANVAMVFANADSGEGSDRLDLNLQNNGNELIQTVANANKNTVVVIHSVGPVLMPWIDHPNITAIVWPGLPGQESGNALADVLFGDVNPSGRLPYTIGKSESDYPADVSNAPSFPYSEGLFIGYRWFDAKNITPNFEFGFGLSYTTFKYSGISFRKAGQRVTVTVQVHNSGKLDGAEVAQLYLGFPSSVGEPPKILRGFDKVFLKAGASTTVTFKLTPASDMSYWDVQQQAWVVPSGTFAAYVGASSRDIRQTATLN
ncbi:hypothetical protein BZG36_04403, partial [Bifiguratus adelaidae]